MKLIKSNIPTVNNEIVENIVKNRNELLKQLEVPEGVDKICPVIW